MSRWLTANDVAADLNFHPKTIREWCRDGVFPGAAKWPDNRRTAEWRIPSADLAALKRERAEKGLDVPNDRLDELMDAVMRQGRGEAS